MRHHGLRSAVPTLLFLLALHLALLPAAAQETAPPAGAPDPAGEWSGTIELPGSPLEVHVELARDDVGAWTGEIDIPAQGARDLALDEIAVDGRSVGFRIAGIPGEPTFRGTLSEDGQEIAGDFTQGGATLAFTLRRGGEGAGSAAGRPDSAAALADLAEVIERGLAALHVPGVAVAVVVDGEIVLSRGFGRRDVEKELPVTPHTVFAIGSSTKAMTTMVLGSLVDDGLVAWDEPVRTYLPSFRLADPSVAERLTVRDLVTHRSGLPRHDLVWYGSDRSREELLGGLADLELSAGLRERFQYQNLMFMTAGYLSGELAGSSWEELMEERLFEPLGMDETVISRFEGLPDVAVGYDLDLPEGAGGGPVREAVPYRVIEAMGPAGSVNSTADDMARWVRFQLGDGSVAAAAGEEGRRIVSETTLQELHTPQMIASLPLAGLIDPAMSPYILYGLGWFIQPYRGHHLVQHGGNIDGFSAMVAFLPQEEIGVVVLSNLNGSPLPLAIALSAFDRLLGLEPVDWVARADFFLDQALSSIAEQRAVQAQDRVAGTEPSHPLEAYAGEYRHPAYGTVRVRLEDGSLRAALNGLDELPLEHWHYDAFQASDTPVGGLRHQFLTGPDGRIDRVEVALEPTVGAIVFAREASARLSEPAFLARLAGEYDLLGRTVTVAVRGETLTVTIPGQPTYEVVPHAATETTAEYRLAEVAGYRVRFELEEGEATSLAFLQPNGVFIAKRK
jgi:CubicO group peptidase (beta-lactamase class C family)